MRLSIVTLGCDKNTVDSERYLAQLAARGAEYTDDLSAAEVIVVNTCGFIDAAKRESIDAIVDAGRWKTHGSCRTVVAVGCMVERHKRDLEDALPEVDLFLGGSEMDRLIPALEERGMLGEPLALHPGSRVFTGDLRHVRYLKISEGCDHGCAFCAIPLMRGKHRSFAAAEIVREAQLLELQGAREINLVAQDLAHYGRDRRDGVRLPELLESLLAGTSVPWYRLMYLYSSGITPRLLEVMASHPRIVPYLDMPMQHASDAVLARMRRPERERTIRDRVAQVRAAIPGLAIRTTCIVGFPGEREEDFTRLLEFLEDVQFERVGVFTYSAQDGTRAFDMADDVPDSLKRERLERLEELQRAITAERYESRIGQLAPALIERGATGEGPATGRLVWQADDIDGVTTFEGDAPEGSIVDARVLAVEDDYDFRARAERVLTAPAASASLPPARRALPMATTIGSYGR